MEPTSPGWYPDPQGTGGERWFDGTNWSTDNVRPAQPPQAPPPPPSYGQPTTPQYGDPGGHAAGAQYGQPGTPLPPPVGSYMPAAQSTSNTRSIIGIVCGVIALFFCPPGFGIAGIVLGITGKRNGERLGNVAIIVASIGLVLGMIIAASLLVAARH